MHLLLLAVSNRRGTVAILTAAFVSTTLLLSLGMVGIVNGYTTRSTLKNVAQAACNRSIKPTRMKIYEDAARTSSARQIFDRLAAERKLSIVSRTVDSDWLTTTITAKASVPTLLFQDIVGSSITVGVTERCDGIPPYPAKNDVILTSMFTRPDGTDLPMKNGSWGVYQPAEFGWEFVSGPGIEIQDWHKNPSFGTLPKGSDNPYVVELDSHYGPAHNPGNSAMGRILELHRGVYAFSFWYFGRQSDVSTNRISVYLEGVRPVSPRVQKLTIAEPRSKGWIYATFEIPVSTYSIYRLIIAAEGTDDTFGGNFNDLKLTYIKRPQDL